MVLVDIALEPSLPGQVEYHIKRHHVFAFDLLPGSYTVLVGLLVAFFSQVLNQGNENIFWVVLLKLQLRVKVSLRRGLQSGLGNQHCLT